MVKTSTELRFGFWDVTARKDAVLSSSENQIFTPLDTVNVDEPYPTPDVATLEEEFGWPLNGSKRLIDGEGGPFGWWSVQQSGADGTFPAPPALTVTFTQAHSSMGLSFLFAGTLPETIQIQWYSPSGALMEDASFHPDVFQYFAERQVEGFGKLVVTVPRMRRGGRFLRVAHIIFGALELLTGPGLSSATLTEEVDETGLTLPVGTLEAVFTTPDGRFSLTDLSGAYRLFQRRQPIEIYETIGTERRFMGVQYLDELTATVDGVTGLTCTDILGVLDGIEHRGGIYSGVAAEDLLDELLTAQGVAYTLDPALQGVTLTGYLGIGTYRTALQQAAFALGAIVDASRSEGVTLYPVPQVLTQTVTPGRKERGHQVRLEPLVTRVNVTAHTYRLESGTVQLVSSRYAVGTHTIRLTTPASISAVTGGTLVESGVNYAVVEVTTEGEVVITGRSYMDDKTIFTAGTTALTQEDRENVKSVEDATLVDRGKAQALADRLYHYYEARYTDEGLLLPGAERVGVLTSLERLGGRTLTGIISHMRIDLTGGYLARMTMRGR